MNHIQMVQMAGQFPANKQAFHAFGMRRVTYGFYTVGKELESGRIVYVKRNPGGRFLTKREGRKF